MAVSPHPAPGWARPRAPPRRSTSPPHPVPRCPGCQSRGCHPRCCSGRGLSGAGSLGPASASLLLALQRGAAAPRVKGHLPAALTGSCPPGGGAALESLRASHKRQRFPKQIFYIKTSGFSQKAGRCGDGRTHVPQRVLLNQESSAPQGTRGNKLETFWLSQLGGSYWHPATRHQGRRSTRHRAQANAPHKE